MIALSLPLFADVGAIALSPPGGLLIALGTCTAVCGAIVLWLVFGSGPRRARGFRRCQRLLRQGNWQESLRIVQNLQSTGKLNSFWLGRFGNVEGECLRLGASHAILAGDFEKGLEQHLRAAELLNLNPAQVRTSIVEAMLAQARTL